MDKKRNHKTNRASMGQNKTKDAKLRKKGTKRERQKQNEKERDREREREVSQIGNEDDTI